MNEDLSSRAQKVRVWLGHHTSAGTDAAILAGVIAAYAPAGSSLQRSAAAFAAGFLVAGTRLFKIGDQFIVLALAAEGRSARLLWQGAFVATKTPLFTALGYGLIHIRGSGGWPVALYAVLISLGVSIILCAFSMELSRYLRGSSADATEHPALDLFWQVQAPIYIVIGGLVAVAVIAS